MTHSARWGAVALALLSPAAFGHGDQSLGKIRFPVSCNAQAAKLFEQGMLLQYSYHWGPARKAFEGAAAADPKCGMAHFGVALTQMDNILGGVPSPQQLAEGKAAVARARAAGLPTQREGDYVTAAEQFFAGDEKQPGPERMEAFEHAMQKVAAANPRDTEASVLHAWSLLGAAPVTDKTYAKQLKAAGILEKIAKTQPDHPGVVHFLVHSYDYPALAKHGVPSARKYSKLAAAAPHALHMPSHIFTRMGYWQDSVDSNIASAKSCGDIDWCKLHAYDYMIYAYLQQGKPGEAAKIVDMMRDYTIKTAESRFVAAYALASGPLRLALETEQWKVAAGFTLPAATDEAWTKAGSPKMIYTFGRGLGAARAGDVDLARESLKELNALNARFTERGDKYWSAQSAVHAKTIEGWIARAEGRREDAIRLMREAADMEDQTEKHPVTPGPLAPVREMLAELMLEAGDAKGAYGEFVKTLEREPGRRRTLTGAATAAERVGDATNAKKYRQMLGTAAADTPIKPVAAKADEVDPCPCRYCRET